MKSLEESRNGSVKGALMGPEGEDGRLEEAVQCSDLESKASARRLSSGPAPTLTHESVGSEED